MTAGTLPLKPVSTAAGFFLNLLYPPRCMGCGAFLPVSKGLTRLSPKDAARLLGTGGPDGLLSGWLCDECRDSVIPVCSPFCVRCGEEFRSRVGSDHVCGACAADPPPFDSARSALYYTGGLAEAIIRMKYRGRMELGRPLGYVLADAFLRYFSEDPPDLAVPVPLHGKRLRSRGFNQVMLLLAECERVPGFPPIAPSIMRRLRPTPAQATLDRAHRAANVRKAFMVDRPGLVEGKKILLLDDVHTTGATSRECAKVLKKAGAARVDVLTLARVAVGI